MPLETFQKYVSLKTAGISLLSVCYAHAAVQDLTNIPGSLLGSGITEARGRLFNFMAFPPKFNFHLEFFLKSINPSHLHECLTIVSN